PDWNERLLLRRLRYPRPRSTFIRFWQGWHAKDEQSYFVSRLVLSRQASIGAVNGRAEMKVDLALSAAVQAATSVGVLMRRQLGCAKRAFSVTQHDIKLELDVRCQKMIERRLRAAFPEVG